MQQAMHNAIPQAEAEAIYDRYFDPKEYATPEYLPAGTFSGLDKPVQPQDSRVIQFPAVGKYTDAADDLDSARFAKAVAAHVSQHFPGTLYPAPDLPECKVVLPDDMSVAQVAHDLGFTPPPVKQGNVFRDPPFYSAYDAEYAAGTPQGQTAPVSHQRVEDNQAVPFDFHGDPVRVMTGRDGEPWFIAKDVAEALGIAWNGTRNIQHVPDDWRGVESVSTPSGIQAMAVLSEQGLYFFLGRSDKPKALPFQRWIAGEVVPTIRKHGAYMTPQTIEDVLENPDLVIGLATKLKEERARTAALEVANARIEAEKIRIAEENIALEIEKHGLVEENAVLAPKAEIYDAFMDSTGTIEIDGAAKLLQNDFSWIGPQKLWNLLKRRGVILKNRDPKQYHLKAGYFRSIVRDEDHERAEKYGYEPYRQTRVTPNGMVFLHRLLRSEERLAERNKAA